MYEDKKNYFQELRQQIMSEENWIKDKFVVYDYEAGTGKSQSTFIYLAELANERPHRVLYVQRFVRDEELDNTVATINSHAGKRVAEGFYSKLGEKVKKEVVNAQILCISHQMYLQVCKGKRDELIKEREILIIDEYPDVVERITFTQEDIGDLWMKSYSNNQLETLANLMRKKRYECKGKSKLKFIDFNEEEFLPFKKILAVKSNKLEQIIGQSLLEKLQQIFLNGCFFYENAFHTFSNQIKLTPLKNNIILDANGGFDYRYSLSNKFLIRKQAKFYDHSRSTLQHFPIKTDKTALNKQINLAENTFKGISLENRGKILIVTDKNNADKVMDKVFNYLSPFGFTKGESDKKVSVDYFGNIIGVNKYRDFDTIIVIKTPFYDYLSYALSYFYYQSMEKKTPMDDIEVFMNDDVERIRETVVSGEFYQAIKRINRDNRKSALIVVCTDYQEAINMVVEQLPNIQYKAVDLEVSRLREEQLPENSTKARVIKAKKFLLEQKEAGVKEIRKSVLKGIVGVNNSANFKNKILNNLAMFFSEHDITMEGQRIVFK